jgi:hypothetical protein
MGPISTFGELPLILATPVPLVTALLVLLSLLLRNPWLCAASCLLIPLMLAWELAGSAVDDNYFMGVEGGCRGTQEAFLAIFALVFCACAYFALRPIIVKNSPE